MILRTPRFLEPIFYAGLDRRARPGDELLGLSIGNRYLGIYPTSTGFEVSYGTLNAQGAL